MWRWCKAKNSEQIPCIMGTLSHRLTGRLMLCALFSQRCITALDTRVKAEVRRDHLISSNEMVKYCQMPLVPPLPGDKQMSLSLPNSATHLGYVRLGFHMLWSWRNPWLDRFALQGLQQQSYPTSTAESCFLWRPTKLLCYQKRQWWYHIARP